MSDIPAELLDAYQKTTYIVFVKNATGVGQINLRLGERSAELDSLLKQYSVRRWAYLTAFNPRSTLLGVEENLRRHAELLSWLISESSIVFPGRSVADDGVWPAEESALALGMSRQRAREIAAEFGQYGFLYGETGAPAELILCAAGGEGK